MTFLNLANHIESKFGIFYFNLELFRLTLSSNTYLTFLQWAADDSFCK